VSERESEGNKKDKKKNQTGDLPPEWLPPEALERGLGSVHVALPFGLGHNSP